MYNCKGISIKAYIIRCITSKIKFVIFSFLPFLMYGYILNSNSYSPEIFTGCVFNKGLCALRVVGLN